jgi:hypothetical protein
MFSSCVLHCTKLRFTARTASSCVPLGHVSHVLSTQQYNSDCPYFSYFSFSCSCSRNLSRILGQTWSSTVSETIQKGETSIFPERETLAVTLTSLSQVTIYMRRIFSFKCRIWSYCAWFSWSLARLTLNPENVGNSFLRNVGRSPDYTALQPRRPYSFPSIFLLCNSQGARSSVIVWGTMLQAGRSWVRFPLRSLNFSIYLILPAVIWSWGRLSL